MELEGNKIGETEFIHNANYASKFVKLNLINVLADKCQNPLYGPLRSNHNAHDGIGS